MLSRLWQENKRFILVAGSGLAVFLILNAIIGGCLARAESAIQQSSRLQKESRQIHKELKSYWDEKARLADYEKHEGQLRAELDLPLEKELEQLDKGAPIVQFNRAIDRAWAQAREKANQMGVAIPDKLGPQDFGVDRGDTEREYERHYAYLGILRRALLALVEAGMAEIGRPEPIQEVLLPVIPNDASLACRLQTVRFRVSGTFDSFVKVLKSLQAPQGFLQVSIASLSGKTGDDRTVKGDLEFTAFRIVEGAATARDEKPAARTQGRPKRGRR